MWLFTKYGFFSVVCAHKKAGEVDYNTFQVRARVREHLENLLVQFKWTLNGYKIFETKDSDYQFRIFVAREDWSNVMSSMEDQIDYTNFKDQCHAHGPDAYNTALMQVWQIMSKLQPCKPYSQSRVTSKRKPK